MPGPPVISPNRQYVAASNWSQAHGTNEIALWKVVRGSKSASFNKVWGMNLDEGGQGAKWGPGRVRWLNETTFEFPRLSTMDQGTLESQFMGWMRVSLHGNQWQPITASPTAAQPLVAPSSNSSNSSPRRRLTSEEQATCRAQAEQGRNHQEQQQLFRECQQGMLTSASTIRSTQPNIPTPQSQGNNPNKWPQEIQEYVGSMHTVCNEIGTPSDSSNDFVQSADLNGDGLADWVLDERAYSCEGAASLFGGGSGGSQTVVWAGLPGGVLSKSFEHANFGIEITVRHGRPTLFFQVGGPLCAPVYPQFNLL